MRRSRPSGRRASSRPAGPCLGLRACVGRCSCRRASGSGRHGRPAAGAAAPCSRAAARGGEEFARPVTVPESAARALTIFCVCGPLNRDRLRLPTPAMRYRLMGVPGTMDDQDRELRGHAIPSSGTGGPIVRGALQAVSGSIPILGGILSAAAGYWSERDQQRVNEFLQAWLKMLQDEFREKEQVIGEIVTRLDVHDDEIAKRVRSDEYQSLLRKAFRNWAGAESAKKREYIRNILSNAAATHLTSDEVVTLFLDWLQRYSEFHFAVIADIYHHVGSTRADVWERLGRGDVREDSADADLFKLLIRELSTGGVIRQHRETDYAGNFLAKPRPRHRAAASGTLKSAFDDTEQYELTELGKQFVHYAMTEVTVKVEYQPNTDARSDTKPRSEEVAAAVR